jgi:hypothetical protein
MTALAGMLMPVATLPLLKPQEVSDSSSSSGSSATTAYEVTAVQVGDVGTVPETRGLYSRTRPTPDGGTSLITPLIMDPTVPGRMWSQGVKYAQLGYGPVDGSVFTPVGGARLPGGNAITGLFASPTHLWATMGPMTPGKGSVWRSPLPAASFTGSTGHGLSFTKVFDLVDPPSGITVGDNAYWRNSSLATDATGQRVMLLEYGTVITGGPSAYFSIDAGTTWTKVKTWAKAKHGHAVRWHKGQWWVQLGDTGFSDLGVWSAPDSEPFMWRRRSTYQMATSDSAEYGINIFPITVNGIEKMVVEADTLSNFGPLFLPTGTPDNQRSFIPSARLPIEHKGTMRQLTYDPETGNLYWYQTCELGVLNTTDSIWMLAPPYTQPILLESFPYQGAGGETQGDPVIYGDYLWLGRNCIRKELTMTQV